MILIYKDGEAKLTKNMVIGVHATCKHSFKHVFKAFIYADFLAFTYLSPAILKN
eukprot:c15720_g1_i1 orf=20-181(-)